MKSNGNDWFPRQCLKKLGSLEKNKQVIAVEEATSTYKWLSDFPK